jgi:hypothetical protein
LKFSAKSMELSPSSAAANRSKIYQHFVETKGSLPCLQEPSNSPYPEPDHCYLSKIDFNIILPPTSRSSFRLAFSPTSYIFHLLLYVCYMRCPFYPPWLDHFTSRRVQVTKLPFMQFSHTSCHFISLWSKYSPQHPVLKHPHSVFLPQCQRPDFTPVLELLKQIKNIFLFLLGNRRRSDSSKFRFAVVWLRYLL